ncbi:MAG: DUF2085 domain-containing protein [Candidatus Altiarchaeales archaeon]|nr:DUF2085 domain-containing protein [Candidatus Altiarchaeales archaeon]
MSAFYMCHQLPERSFFLFGMQYPICARCVGIYIGGSLGGFLALYYERPKRLSGKMLLTFFIVLTLPMALDGVTQTLLYQRESSNLTRLVTGLLFGFGVLYAITSVISGKAKALSAQLKDVSKIAFGVNTLMVAIILIASLYYGIQHVSKQTALNSALEYSNINPVQTIVIYIPPNAVRNIKNDPYLKSYNDVILADMLGVRYDDHKHGVWAVVLLSEQARYEGKTVFLSETGGEYIYSDAYTGKLINSKTH